ncbi:oligoribonuclease [Ruicaihuangia caeni]|uniref:Oligoribonuclease n=1 Tax=Ruicaihuangia caeni TaxID=3042517 RepID=A0AAW6T7Z1_9MICO|nr:oligoribonuclease [Klugiella sp. YN-L-19]MDI2097767.1 oligoribonuclease [Klugiella sp. YN-L-19]
MSENLPTIARGEEYVVFYRGGAYDGQTDRRIATEDGWDDEINVMTLVDGTDTMLAYQFQSARRLGDQLQVTYVWDAADSDAIEDPDERNEH